jgi:hypothetical protein
VLAAVAAPAELDAQNGPTPTSSALLVFNPNARAAALGGAYVLSTAESDGIFHHPGLIDAGRGISLSRAFLGSDGAALSLSGSGEWFRGGIGFGLQSLNTDSHTEQVASLAYARTRSGLRVGVAAKVVDQRVGDERETYGAADVGVARTIGNVTAGLTARNIGADPSFDSGDGRLPTALTLGAASRSRATGPLDLLIAARATWMRDSRFGFGGGVEAAYWPVTGRTFAVRAGYSEVGASSLKPLTLGAGFSGDRISVDYAFQDGEGASRADVHRITLRWR